MKNVLVVGGNSRLAKEIKKIIKNKNFNIYYTHRKKYKNSLQLNIKKPNLKKIKEYINKKNINSVIFCAGITDYYDCKKNFKKAYEINCIQTTKLIKLFLNLNIFTCFVSTNTVFEKKTPQNEYDEANPKFDYSKMKKITENKIISYSKKKKIYKKLSILRLTKNVNKKTEPFNSWIKFIKQDKKIKCFNDLFFAPVRFRDSAEILFKIIQKEAYGIFHLSGEKDLNYYEFARLLVKKLNKSYLQIISTTSTKEKKKLLFKNSITALGMKNTKKKLKFYPVKITKIVNELV